MGSRGSLILSRNTEFPVPAVQASVTDTIGAGDSFMAALIGESHTAGGHDLSPSSLERIAGVAPAAAAITVSRPSAHFAGIIDSSSRSIGTAVVQSSMRAVLSFRPAVQRPGGLREVQPRSVRRRRRGQRRTHRALIPPLLGGIRRVRPARPGGQRTWSRMNMAPRQAPANESLALAMPPASSVGFGLLSFWSWFWS